MLSIEGYLREFNTFFRGKITAVPCFNYPSLSSTTIAEERAVPFMSPLTAFVVQYITTT